MKSFKRRFKSLIKYVCREVIHVLRNLIWEEMENIRREQLTIKVQNLLQQLQSCGEGVRINGNIFISDPKSVAIGNNVHIGDDAFFSTEGGLTIGDNSHLSRNVTIYTVNHDYGGESLPHDNHIIPKPVSIGKNVWVGMNVSIVPGVRIGDGAVIGMGTVVRRDVPPLAVISSQEAVILKERDKVHYMELEKKKRYGGINGCLLTQKETNRHWKNAKRSMESIFFVVTTGRSGSMTVANVLSQHPKITCFHELRPQLIRLSTEFAHGFKELNQIQKELYDIYCNSSVFPKGIYGELDQKLWNLISVLSELIPKCKFVWLVRNARDVVASTIGRGWFSPEQEQVKKLKNNKISDKWKYYRLNGAKCGFFNQKEWESLSIFEKNCWYWFYVNSQIEKQLKAISKERWIMVRLEELGSELSTVFTFLGLEPILLKVGILNSAQYDKKHWESWNRIEQISFDRWCGGLMNRLYSPKEDSFFEDYVGHIR